jgi:hypothetical protein
VCLLRGKKLNLKVELNSGSCSLAVLTPRKAISRVLEEASLKETKANDFTCGWPVDTVVYSFVDLQFAVSMFATFTRRFVTFRTST